MTTVRCVVCGKNIYYAMGGGAGAEHEAVCLECFGREMAKAKPSPPPPPPPPPPFPPPNDAGGDGLVVEPY